MADEPRLSERAELLLATFPVPEVDWEAQARAVEARLSAVTPGSTEARWLEAPLPTESPEGGTAKAEHATRDARLAPTETPFPFASMASIIEAPPSEPHRAEAGGPAAAPAPNLPAESGVAAPDAPAAAAVPVRAAATVTPLPGSGNSQSLSALARSMAQKGGRAQAPRDIARESLSVAAAARSHSEGMVERVRTARPAPPPPPSHRPAHPSTPSARPTSNQQLGPWIAVGGIGIAAAVALWVFERPPAPSALPVPAAEPVAVVAREPARQVEAPAAPQAAAKVAEDSNPRAATDEASAPPTLAASALPLAPRAGLAVAAAPARGAEVAGGAAGPAAAAAPPAGVAGAARPAPESIVLEDTAANSKLATDKAGTATPAASGLRPAAGSPSGGLPDRPSTGAVQAAVGSVMGAARACVAGGVATPAQVNFGSDGTVKAVTVSGPNAGTAAASCIDGALRRARVAPFASPTFSLMVWVRP